MDFVFQDENQDLIWKVFTAPRPELHQTYLMPRDSSLSDHLKYAQDFNCSGPTNNDTCTATQGGEG